ncbi:hypothetical protein JKF63_05007 [Porcisia hertigi]|uniref:Vacuolar protein sorting-associated protein 51 homolog n=1 Tax=Porcisia hertigi TaxID=2761500 RepID=A0A836LCT5_9TRYP|nr:hypothetical protein JKF63_05007 [Porcisia hertigi]
MSMHPRNAAERRQHLRDQMKAFYGDPNASTTRQASQSSTQGNPNVPPELDLDSEHFNVNRYTTDLLKRESLKGLVETDTALLRRVRRLDGELQELVYRNYARFISATETIREMKDNVVEMDAKLQTLSKNVNTIDKISSQITQQLQVHREHIENTITANRMLKKVQFLTSLPTTMRRLMDKEEYNVCVKYWVAGNGFLSKHKSIASITQVQQNCSQLARELYSTIEQRMCSYPLDDPDSMDRIRSYVENLRLLRATSLFGSDDMTDQAPFEETVLQTLMMSVTASFQANVAAALRSLKAALIVPDDLQTSDMAKRKASLAEVNLREPLAQLKNACAMLAVNAERVYALLDVEVDSSGDNGPAAALVAKSIQPVLFEVLQPISQSLADFAMSHLNAIAMDGTSALRNPKASAEALRAATTHLARLLKQFVTAVKTLAEIYLPAMPSGADEESDAAAPAAHDAVHLYTRKVHEVLCSVVRQCWEQVQEKVLQGPEPELLKTHSPLPISNASLLGGTPPTVDEEQTHELAFVLTRFLYASLAQCVSTSLLTTLVDGESVPADMLTPITTGLEQTAQQLQHRGIVFLGQLEVKHVYKAFSGNSEHDSTTATGPTVPEVLLLLLPQWTAVYDVLKALPPVTAASAAAAAAAATTGGGASSPPTRRRDKSGFGGGNIHRGGGSSSISAYGTGAGGGSSTGTRSDHRAGGGGGPAAHRRGGSSDDKLAVSYTRQVMTTLQVSVNHIFANADTWLRTEPVAGPPSVLMACVVRYLLKGILDRVRDEATYTQAQFQQLQVSCTFVLYALASPAKGSAPRQWRKEWSEEDMHDVQRLLDEICTCAYDKYEAKVPLSSAVLDRVVEAAVRSGRAALETAHMSSGGTAMAATVVPMPPAVTVVFPGENANDLSLPPPQPENSTLAVSIQHPQQEMCHPVKEDPPQSPTAASRVVPTGPATSALKPSVSTQSPKSSATPAPPPPPAPAPGEFCRPAATPSLATTSQSPVLRSLHYSSDSHTERYAHAGEEEELPL